MIPDKGKPHIRFSSTNRLWLYFMRKDAKRPVIIASHIELITKSCVKNPRKFNVPFKYVTELKGNVK